MRAFLLGMVTWWNGQTPSLRFWTWRRGVAVGSDEEGNRYYQDRKDPKRRWVVYNGFVEASKVPPVWHAWLHHLRDALPEAPHAHLWMRRHEPNMTGTEAAWRPPGSLHAPEPSASIMGDYESWSPPQTKNPQKE